MTETPTSREIDQAWAQAAYWVLRAGPVLYRRLGLQDPGPGPGLQRWDRVTREWVDDTDWYGDVLDGATEYDDLTPEQARARFPAAFR